MLLQSNNTRLFDFPSMPVPDIDAAFEQCNRLIYDELNYDREALCQEHINLMSTMTGEHCLVYDKIMSRIVERKAGLFFINGFGGLGKTYI